MMHMANRSKQGWTQQEQQLLRETVEQTLAQGQPLRAAFECVATQTGRKANSMRNYYYTATKQGFMQKPEGSHPAFVPFTQEEVERLVETVLCGQAQGKSVRSMAMQLGEQDQRAMLRFQNKYRSVLKNDPEMVYRVMEKMAKEGKQIFDPYAQPRPHRSGRKPLAVRHGDVDEATAKLAASLKELRGVDAAGLVSQLAAICDMARAAKTG